MRRITCLYLAFSKSSLGTPKITYDDSVPIFVVWWRSLLFILHWLPVWSSMNYIYSWWSFRHNDMYKTAPPGQRKPDSMSVELLCCLSTNITMFVYHHASRTLIHWSWQIANTGIHLPEERGHSWHPHTVQYPLSDARWNI